MKRFWERLAKRERRLVALAFLILLLVLGRYVLISPFLERREWVLNELEIRPQVLEKNVRYLGQKKAIEEGLERARNQLILLEPSMLSGDTPPVSASHLQELVQNFATRGGAQVITTRVLNPVAAGAFTRIPIQVEVAGHIDQIANLIRGIESADKLLVLNELNVRSLISPAQAQRRPGAPATTPAQSLRVSLTVSGFVRKGMAEGREPQVAPGTKGGSAAAKSKAQRAEKKAEPAKGRPVGEEEEE